MKSNLNWKLLVIFGLVVVCLYYLYPTIRYATLSDEKIEELGEKAVSDLKANSINLGLDLQGGMHMVLKVQTDEAVTAEILRYKSDIVELFKKDTELKILPSEIKILGEEIIITNPDRAKLEMIRKKILSDIADFNFSTSVTEAGAQQLSLSLKETQITAIKDRAFQQALETIRNRVDEFGVSEPTIQRQGLTGARILIQLPGIEDVERAKSIIGRTAQLKFHLVKDMAPNKKELLAPYDGNVPNGYIVTRGGGSGGGERDRWYYLLEEEARVTGNDLENAFVGTDEFGMPGVDFVFKSAGASKFRRLTSSNIGRELAIVLDGQVQSAPRIQSTISKRGQITGNFSAEEAQDLSLVLRAGALPASVVYLEERTVGPSLGKDSINQGIMSALVGMVFVLIFMVFYYRSSGLIADVALVSNILILTAAMAGLGATLTLPGIAGIILTIGMAVDANVLIFERIREELRLGKTARTSIFGGFSKAALTIVDANVTTIIAAFVLLHFGTGPVRGFAVTLSIGIAASMFSALFVSRVIFEFMQDRFQFKEIKYVTLFKETNIDFVGKRVFFMIMSLIVIAIGMGSVVLHGGLNYGIDFAGGTLVQLKFEKPLEIQAVRESLKEINLGDSVIQKYGSDSEVLIRTIKKATDSNEFLDSLWRTIEVDDYKSAYTLKNQSSTKLTITANRDSNFAILKETIEKLPFPDVKTEFDSPDVTVTFHETSAEISDILKKNFADDPFEIRKVEMVGPQVGKELRTAALIAIIMAMVGIVIYITIRFEFRYAIAAILALLHDVLITVGIFSVTNREFNLPIVAAVLTIVGYSLNDTIVVFDRLRENTKMYRKDNLLTLINNSINQTLSRTLLTSLTTLFVVLCLFIFGGEVIHDFAFALLVGIMVGTYSSVYVASPFLLIWEKILGSKTSRRGSGRKNRK